MADSDLAEQATAGEVGHMCQTKRHSQTHRRRDTGLPDHALENQERDVPEVLGHTTERDDPPVRELSIIPTKDAQALAGPNLAWPRSGGGSEIMGDHR